MGYAVTFAAQANRDLEQIVRFRAQDNPAVAERLGYAIVERAQTLRILPRRGWAVRDRPGYWRILHPPWYLLFYRICPAKRMVCAACRLRHRPPWGYELAGFQRAGTRSLTWSAFMAGSRRRTSAR